MLLIFCGSAANKHMIKKLQEPELLFYRLLTIIQLMVL